MQSYERRPRENLVRPAPFNRRYNPHSPERLIADQKARDYVDSLKRKLEYRVGRNLYSEDPVDDVAGRHSPGSAAVSGSPSKRNSAYRGFEGRAGQNNLRVQSQNLFTNTPGANRKVDIERELYSDFKHKFGLEKPEDSNLVFSPEAEFRRKQIYKYKETGKDLPGFAVDNAYSYGNQIGQRANQRRGKQAHNSRFP